MSVAYWIWQYGARGRSHTVEGRIGTLTHYNNYYCNGYYTTAILHAKLKSKALKLLDLNKMSSNQMFNSHMKYYNCIL